MAIGSPPAPAVPVTKKCAKCGHQFTYMFDPQRPRGKMHTAQKCLVVLDNGDFCLGDLQVVAPA